MMKWMGTHFHDTSFLIVECIEAQFQILSKRERPGILRHGNNWSCLKGKYKNPIIALATITVFQYLFLFSKSSVKYKPKILSGTHFRDQKWMELLYGAGVDVTWLAKACSVCSCKFLCCLHDERARNLCELQYIMLFQSIIEQFQ